MTVELRAAVDLYWLPLGAGGHFVRLNGRLYEALVARLEKRQRRALYHSALVVTVPAGEFVIEQAWPIPDRDGAGAASSLKARSGAAGRVRCGSSATRSDAGPTVSSPTLARRSIAHSD